MLPLAAAPLVDAYVKKEKLGEEQARFPLDLFLCLDCGFAQLLDDVDPEILYRDYLYETKSSLGLPEHFGRYAADVIERIKPSPGALAIDIGSNDGTPLKIFKDRGLKVPCIDPAREIAAAATKEGIETLPDFFGAAYAKKLRAERGPATIVTANNFYANFDDLVDLTEGVRALLGPDGVFVFESSYAADMISNMVFDFIYHEHLSYFSVKPVQKFFKRMGMELVDVQHTSPKGGSMRYTAQLAGGPRQVSAAVGAALSAEEKLGIHKPETFKAWSEKIEALKKELLALIKGLKAKGKTVAAFGASATTTTLIYHFELYPLIDFLVDDYAWKQGKFSPGAHIPVLPSSALYEKKPDYCLMAAWRYAEPIIAKNRKNLNQGGQFIIPLPKVEIHGPKTAAR